MAAASVAPPAAGAPTPPGWPTGRGAFTPAEWQTVLHILEEVVQHPEEHADEAEAILSTVAPLFALRGEVVLELDKSCPGAAPAAAAEAPPPGGLPEGGVVRVPDAFSSRPLYPNPVCILSTWREPAAGVGPNEVNLMTISWLTPINNQGGFCCAMNQFRYSAQLLTSNPIFCLSVPVRGMEALVLRIGSCTGRRRSKPHELAVPLCRPGWTPLPESMLRAPAQAAPSAAAEGPGASCVPPQKPDGSSPPGWPVWPIDRETDLGTALLEQEAQRCAVAVAPCVAHVLACVRHVRPMQGHFLLTCDTLAAYTKAEYWSGKTLQPQRGDLPEILTFLGSQRFGYVAC